MNPDTRRYWIDWTRKGPDGKPGLITSDFTDATGRVIRSIDTRAATAPIDTRAATAPINSPAGDTRHADHR